MIPALRAAVFLLLAAAALAACSPPAAGPTAATPRASAAQVALCRQRADTVFEAQNRGAKFRTDSRDNLFSGQGAPGGEVARLSDRFARDRMVDDCLRGAAGNVTSTPDAPTPTPLPPVVR